MSKQDFDSDLQQQIAALDKHKTPQRDLWQGIELALADQPAPETFRTAQTETPRRAPKLVALAATVAFAGVLSWVGLQQPDGVPSGAVQGQDIVAALSAQHEEQKEALLVKFEDQPAVTENWQQQLQELDQAAKAIRAALEQDPGNIALLKMLQNVHQQQIDLIETVHSPKWRQI